MSHPLKEITERLKRAAEEGRRLDASECRELLDLMGATDVERARFVRMCERSAQQEARIAALQERLNVAHRNRRARMQAQAAEDARLFTEGVPEDTWMPQNIAMRRAAERDAEAVTRHG